MRFLPLLLAALLAVDAFANDPFREWQGLRRGANIFSENSDADLEAAKAFGLKTVRLGATGDQNDFRYLVGVDGQWNLTAGSLSRLKETVRRFKRHGLQVVLTLSHVPGRFWQEGKKDVCIFKDRAYQQAFFSAWKTIAAALHEEDNIAGYDLINEPLLPEEVGQDTSTIDYVSLLKEIENTPSDINEFYQKARADLKDRE